MCVVYAILQQLNLHTGNLNAVADAVGLGRSGAGVKNRLKNLKESFEEGSCPELEELFASVEARNDEGAQEEGEEANE